ncbi:MAG: YtxH domain-containing protein [Acidobacteriales bacterium]|nr:YtxH domain-containing protein [Terriglobales bacterium]MBV9670032.1 YtxH domain-containing protein [Terriglobales bacterium]
MKMRKENLLMNVLLGTGVYLLDSIRERLADSVDDIRGKAQDHYEDFRGRARDTYETASERVSRASDALRGEDSHMLGTTVSLLLGVGIGVGIGMLLAPASGEETRSNLADKVQDFSGKVRERFSGETGEAARAGYSV